MRFLALSLALIGLIPSISEAQMMTPGKFLVSDGGAATYQVPIQVPPGIAGLEPKLGLVYSSQDTNMVAGVGWSISGLSSITRCPRTLHQDGGSSPSAYSPNDRYCLDSKRLIAISGADGADGTEYRLEIEEFHKVTSTGSTGATPQYGPTRFVVQTRGGLTMEYGGTVDSRIEGAGTAAVRVWALNRVSDSKGNYYTVSYTKDTATSSFLPARIDYTGNAVTGLAPASAVLFDYETRPDVWTASQAGTWIVNDKVLKAIRTTTGTVVGTVMSYGLSYAPSPSSGRLRLTQIDQCSGSGVCMPPIKTDWDQSPNANGFVRSPAWSTGPGVPSGGWISVDLNGDGFEDLVSPGVGVYRNEHNGTFSFIAWSGANMPQTTGTKLLQTLTGDMNGDGRMDVILVWGVCTNTTSGCFDWDFRVSVFINADGGGKFSGGGTYVGTAGQNAVVQPPIDINGDGRADLVVLINGTWLKLRVLESTGSGFIDRGIVFNGAAGSWDGPFRLQLMDINSDGLGDALVWRPSGVLDVYLNNGGYAFTPFIASVTGADGPGSSKTWQTGDFNGDGRQDIVHVASGPGGASVDVLLNTGLTFRRERWADISYSSTDESRYLVLDANGDGKSDIVRVTSMGATSTLTVYRSTGTGFSVESNWLASAELYVAGESWVAVNLNGGAAMGLARFAPDSSGNNTTLRTFTPQLSTLDRAVSIGSLYDRVTIEYKTLPQAIGSTYFREVPSAFPIIDTAMPISVVAGYRMARDARTSMSYGSLLLQATGRQWLGFNWIQSRNDSSGLVHRRYFRQEFPYIGLVDRSGSGTSTASWNNLTAIQNVYECKDFVSASGCTVAAGQRYFRYVGTSTEQATDLSGAPLPGTRSSVTMDDYGNTKTLSVEKLSASGAPLGYRTSTINTYYNDPSMWRIGLLTKSVSTAETPESNPAPTGVILSLSACSIMSPTTAPTPARINCRLGNSGQTAAQAISYTVPAGTTASGPTSCAANTNNCGNVIVRTGTAMGSFSGNVVATPSPAGTAGTVPVTLAMLQPSLQYLPVQTQWGTVGAASDSGDWPTIKNTSAVALLITGHAVQSGPAGMWSWQGGPGNATYCQPGSTVLAPGASCQTFFGTSALATPGTYAAIDQISYQVAGATGATYTVQQSYGFSVATTTPNVSSLSFGNVAVNTTSAAQSVTLTNNATGGGTLANLLITLAGAKPGDFTLAHTCGSALAAGAACTVTVTFKPTAITNGIGASVQVLGSYPRMQAGINVGVVNANGVNLSIPVAGNGTGTAATLTSAASLIVPATWYGGGTQTVTATYRNDGNLPMTLASPALAAPLSVASNGCSAVAAGANCNLVIAAATNVPGLSQSQSFVPSGATTAAAATTVTWSTQSAVPRWSPASLAFGNVGVGLSTSQNLTLFNDGNVAYNWAANSGIANLPAGFSVNTGNCGNVSPGGSCAVAVSFTPSAATSYGGSGISMSAASYNSNTFGLSGTGYTIPVLTAYATSVSATSTAPTAAVGYASYSNSTQTPTTLNLSLSGSGLTLSSTTMTCPAWSALGGGICSGVRIDSPATAGTYTGTITGTSSMGGNVSPISVTLTVLPLPSTTTIVLSPTALDYGAQGLDRTSTAKTVTVSNTGAAAAPITSVFPSGSGGWSFERQGGTCPTDGQQLAAGASCTLGVVFVTGCTSGSAAGDLKLQGPNFTTATARLTGTIKTGKCT